MKTGTLYVVATPIGNLDDITLRALKVLKAAGLIAAEDTRHTKKLLTHYGIAVPLTSYHEHNEREKAQELAETLLSGTDVALVSDAGTPGISDPGYRLVSLAVERGIPVVPVPGPSAMVSLVSVSGLPSDEFTFKGFLPAKEGELKRLLQELKGSEHTYIFYESPSRLRKTLELFSEILGDARLAIGRELTKMYEEVLRGTPAGVLEALKDREVKGEITIVLRTAEVKQETDFRVMLEELLRSGIRLNDAVKIASKDSGAARAEVYKEAVAIKERLKTGGRE